MATTRRRFIAATGGAGLAALAGYAGPNSHGASAQSQPEFIVTHDTVVSAETLAQDQAPCSPESQFLHGQKVIVRVLVIDPGTGEKLEDQTLDSVSLVVENGDGEQTVEGDYGPHPPDDPNAEKYWVVPWTIPEDFPTGPVKYGLLVETIDPVEQVRFDVPTSRLTVLDGTYSTSQG